MSNKIRQHDRCFDISSCTNARERKSGKGQWYETLIDLDNPWNENIIHSDTRKPRSREIIPVDIQTVHILVVTLDLDCGPEGPHWKTESVKGKRRRREEKRCKSKREQLKIGLIVVRQNGLIFFFT